LVKKYERPLPEDIEVREMFNTLDRDRNGFVDPDELKSSFAELGIKLTDADVQVMMDEAGVQGNKIFYRGQHHSDTEFQCLGPAILVNL